MKFHLSSVALALLLAAVHPALPLRAQDAPPTAATPAAPATSPTEPKEPAELADPTVPASPGQAVNEGGQNFALNLHLNNGGDQNVQIGQPIHVKAGEVVPQVVVVNSSATVDGRVKGDVVVIGGSALINGVVEGQVVNVGAGVTLGTGARVEGDVVGVLGGVFLGTNAFIGGQAVGVVGGVHKSEGAQVGGETINIGLANWMGPDGIAMPGWIKATFTQLVLKARLLSFAVGWPWIVALLFLALYLLLVLVAPGAVSGVSDTLAQRGATSFLMGLLALPLGAFVSLILAVTGIGIVVVPFVWASFFFAGLVGKAGLLQFFGLAVGRQSKRQLSAPVAILVGALVVTLLYLIPFLGLLFWAVFTMWALGAALLALFSSFRKERRPTSRPALAAAPVSTPTPANFPASAAMTSSMTDSGGAPTLNPGLAAGGGAGLGALGGATLSAVMPEPLAPTLLAPPAPVIPDALTLPRVGLKDRLLATLLDWLLLGMLMAALHLHRLWILLVLGYFIGFWVWRQTTLGGIVLRLRVARLDGRPVDPATAVVRSLGALFGTVALGLGYIWAGWDAEKQGWHDKIAGTVVVKVPTTQPLV